MNSTVCCILALRGYTGGWFFKTVKSSDFNLSRRIGDVIYDIQIHNATFAKLVNRNTEIINFVNDGGIFKCPIINRKNPLFMQWHPWFKIQTDGMEISFKTGLIPNDVLTHFNNLNRCVLYTHDAVYCYNICGGFTKYVFAPNETNNSTTLRSSFECLL